MGLMQDSLSDSSSNSQPITHEDIANTNGNTFINRTSIDFKQYPRIFEALTSFVDGSPVVVEYFRKVIPYINKQTGDASFSLEEAAIHSSYDLIHKLEFKLQEQLNIEIDPETVEASVTGAGIMYAGLKPNAGDVFYLMLPDDQVGAFIVNEATPLSIHRGSNYMIKFHIFEYVNEDFDASIRSSVVQELHFDKQYYFADQVALLTDDVYLNLKTLEEFRKDMIQRMFSLFYNREEKTLLRTDGVYDAYVVEFLSNKISINDHRLRINQISSMYLDKYRETIWKSMLEMDMNNLTYHGHYIGEYQAQLWDSNLSALGEYPVLIPHKASDILSERITPFQFQDVNEVDFPIATYGFSNRLYMPLHKKFNDGVFLDFLTTDIEYAIKYADTELFYPSIIQEAYCVEQDTYIPLADFSTQAVIDVSNNLAHIPELEYMIYDLVINRNVDIPYLLTSVIPRYPFTNMSDMDKFYFFPVLLHLTDIALTRLK